MKIKLYIYIGSINYKHEHSIKTERYTWIENILPQINKHTT